MMMRRTRHRACLVPPTVVRNAIARAMLGKQAESRDVTMGSVTLREHQGDAATRLRAILQRDHVALLADDVGMGKTYTALAVARDYPETLVIAPAALLPMWRSAVARTNAVGVRLMSTQRFSRSRGEIAPVVATSLVIIDEAHHLRTPNTRRYRAIATLVAGCDVLLVSATPIHNTPRDLRALLALSIGARSTGLDESLLARLIVRRNGTIGRPRVVHRPPIAMPHDPTLLDAILSLPAPLPAHDGAIAGALIRLGLLRAWCSSDAALAGALRRRLLRGEALQQALEAGRHPTAAELRTWLVGEHEVQLAFPELLAGHAPQSGPLLEILSRHLDAVREVLRLVLHRVRHTDDRDARIAPHDVTRADQLRALMAAHDPVPIVAFSQFAETVRTVGRALSDIAGVGVLTGRRAWIASGAISRQEALDSFAPDAQGRPPPPPHQRIRLLLTTDLLAEGVNLQDAGVVVHLDLPWTAALRRQRVGRCARAGSQHAEVVVYEFAPPEGAESVLQLYARLARKARLSNRLVGSTRPARDGGVARTRSSPAESSTAMREILQRWSTKESGHVPEPTSTLLDAHQTLYAAVTGPQHEGVAVIADERGAPLLVALEVRMAGSPRPVARVSRSPRRVVRVLQRLSVAEAADPRCAQHAWTSARKALRRWCERRTLRAELGDDDASASVAHRRARAVVSDHLRRCSPAQRLQARDAVHGALAMLSRVRGAAAEDALRRWVALASSGSPAQAMAWLTGWQAFPVLATGVTLATSAPADDSKHTTLGRADGSWTRPYRVIACLLMLPTSEVLPSR
jgi:superfamily II DNA or RNA helicase